MATLKTKDIQKMNEEERMKKLEEMKFELVKAKGAKAGNSKVKSIKKIIARILTLNNQNKNTEVVKNK